MTRVFHRPNWLLHHAGASPFPGPKAGPFLGNFNSAAFHVRDAAALVADPQIKLFERFADVLDGQMPDDPAPCFAVARGTDPRAPFFIGRQPPRGGDQRAAPGGPAGR